MPLRLWKEKRTLGPTCFFDRCLLFLLDDDGFPTTVQSRPRIRWMVLIIFPHICGPPQWGPLKGHLETRMDPGVSVIRFNSFVLFIRRGLLVKFLWFLKLFHARDLLHLIVRRTLSILFQIRTRGIIWRPLEQTGVTSGNYPHMMLPSIRSSKA